MLKAKLFVIHDDGSRREHDLRGVTFETDEDIRKWLFGETVSPGGRLRMVNTAGRHKTHPELRHAMIDVEVAEDPVHVGGGEGPGSEGGKQD